MNCKTLSLAVAVSAALASSAFALPPRGVNVAVNRMEYLQQCEATCAAHAKTPAACTAQCNAVFAPWYGPPTGIDMSSYNIASCDVNSGAVWAWYAMCVIDISVISDGLSGATDALAALVGSTAASGLMSQIKKVGDGCGYVRDQLLADAAQRCPASILLPKVPVTTIPK